MSQEKIIDAAFVLLLLSGILIIFGSSLTLLFSYYAIAGGYYYAWMRGMIEYWYGYHGTSYSSSQYFPDILYFVSILGIILGALIITSSFMIKANSKSIQWGTLALVSSTVSLLSMGGFFAGAVLGIIGAALAISCNIATQKQFEELQNV